MCVEEYWLTYMSSVGVPKCLVSDYNLMRLH